MPLAAIVLIALAFTAPVAAQPPLSDSPPVALHEAVGDTLDSAEAAYWGIYTDIDGLRRVVFRAAPWGGFLAEIVAVRDGKPIILQRNLRRSEWDLWRANIDRGETSPDPRPRAALPDSGFVWPEAPPPPVIARVDTLLPTLSSVALEPGKWAMMFGVGIKRSTTHFNDYFTPMVLINFGIARPLTRHILPTLSVQLGQGDLGDEFEGYLGDGRSAFYAIEGALRLHTGLHNRRSLYLSFGGGYYMRSFRWGDQYYDVIYQSYQYGSLIREFANWGGSLGGGLQLFTSARSGKAHYLDINLRYEFYSANPNAMEPERGVVFKADDHDSWFVFSVGFVFGL